MAYAKMLRVSPLSCGFGATDRVLSRHSLDELRVAMAHDHPVMRHWGTLGCTVLGTSAKAAAGRLRQLLKDPVEVVRVVAAEAQHVQGDTKAAIDGLVEVLTHDAAARGRPSPHCERHVAEGMSRA